MNFTKEQLEKVRQAVIDMALSTDRDDAVEHHASRVAWWLEHGEAIRKGRLG